MTTAYITDTRYAEHTLTGHVERAERLQAIHALLKAEGIDKHLRSIAPEPITDSQILSVHTEGYLDLLKWTTTRPGMMLGSDTYVLPHSFEIARLSAGAAVRGVDAILSGEAQNALVCARPPGHHAVPDTGMGFCLLSNIAIAARHAQTQYGVGRVLIVDIDVHHGNGTQDIFYADPSVLLISTHQSPFYPGTGAIKESGSGAGQGFTVNLPLPAHTGDAGYRSAYEQVIWPAAQRFRPELILVSAGFDSHWADPLCDMNLTLDGYAWITRELLRMAETLCQGKIAFVLEGGYNLTSLSHGVLNVAHALLGHVTVSDPLGLPADKETEIGPLLAQIRQVHQLEV
jgi:acetoin utilization deacetylase AcuC-like enzyme